MIKEALVTIALMLVLTSPSGPQLEPNATTADRCVTDPNWPGCDPVPDCWGLREKYRKESIQSKQRKRDE
jgi:hypothetical protein